jgi:hypothetical protein
MESPALPHPLTERLLEQVGSGFSSFFSLCSFLIDFHLLFPRSSMNFLPARNLQQKPAMVVGRYAGAITLDGHDLFFTFAVLNVNVANHV